MSNPHLLLLRHLARPQDIVSGDPQKVDDDPAKTCRHVHGVMQGRCDILKTKKRTQCILFPIFFSPSNWADLCADVTKAKSTRQLDFFITIPV
jgi:hypothetical protein